MLVHDEEFVKSIAEKVVESPYQRITKYKESYKFNKEYINALINDVQINTCFEQAISKGFEASESAKRLVWPIQRRLNDSQASFADLAFSQQQYFDFLWLIKDWSLASAQAKIIMKEMIASGKDASVIIEEKWLKPLSEDDIKWFLETIFKENPSVLEDLKSGNMKPKWFVVGQVMKLSWGSADPGMVNEVLSGMM